MRELAWGDDLGDHGKCEQEAACRVMEAGTKYGSSMGFVRHVVELVCLVNGKARMKVMDEVG